jgi:hypothetical protein
LNKCDLQSLFSMIPINQGVSFIHQRHPTLTDPTDPTGINGGTGAATYCTYVKVSVTDSVWPLVSESSHSTTPEISFLV